MPVMVLPDRSSDLTVRVYAVAASADFTKYTIGLATVAASNNAIENVKAKVACHFSSSLFCDISY
jgi:hypothetical protein